MIRNKTNKYRKIRRYLTGGKCKCSSTMTITNGNNSNNKNNNKKLKKIPDMTKLLGENAEEEEVKARQELANAKSQEKRNSIIKDKLPGINLKSLGQQLDSSNESASNMINKISTMTDSNKMGEVTDKLGSVAKMAGPLAGKLGSMFGKKGGKRKKSIKKKKNRKNRKKKSKKLL